MRRAKQAGLTALILAVIAIGSASPDEPKTKKSDPKTDFTLTGPYTHLNLSIFLVHGQDQIKNKQFLTLPEALKNKKAIVHETKNVEELSVENLSNEEIFIQAGDIVKGGQQDRILAVDLIVPAKKGKKSSKFPIASFCCESGRWSRRGDEDVNRFTTGDAQAPTNSLKIAVRKEKSQHSVWQNVAKAQLGLGSGLGMGGGGIGGLGAFQRPAIGVVGELGSPLDDPGSPTSLQLSLENAVLKMTLKAYAANLKAAPNREKDVIGCVVAVNGKVTGAEVYVSNAMFKKLWPSLLEASAIEAIAEWDAKAKPKAVSVETATAFLRDIDAGERTLTEISQRVRLVQRESEKGIVFETRDRENNDVMIRRSYLANAPKLKDD